MSLAADIEEFVTLHRGHGPLTGDAGQPTPNGYRLEIVCPCGVTFERWVTELDAIDDLVREACGARVWPPARILENPACGVHRRVWPRVHAFRRASL